MSRYLKPLVLILLILAGFFLLRWEPVQRLTDTNELLSLLNSIRGTWWTPFVLIAVYGVGGIVGLPGSVLTLVIGALYGLMPGLLYNVIASNLAAATGFAAARWLGRDFLARFLKGRWKEFDEKAAQHGFRVIFYLRLVPLFPFNGINFGAGLSKIRFRDFAFASVIGMLPGTFVYTYFASALISGTVEARHQATFHLILSSVLFVLLSLLPVLLKRRVKQITSS